MSGLTTTKFSDWIRPLITSGTKVVSGRLPDVPNRVIAITKGSGPGLTFDGQFDIKGFVVQCRGGEQNLADAESIADEVDDIFLGKHPTAPCENFLIGSGAESVYVSRISRTGSGPTQLAIPDSQSRWIFSCSYLVEVSTNVGQVFNG
jgi:hypothetical protein